MLPNDHNNASRNDELDQISSRFTRYSLSKLLSTTGRMEYYISYLINMSMWLMTSGKPFNESEVPTGKYIKKLVDVYDKHYKKGELTSAQKQRMENEILSDFLKEIFPDKSIDKNLLRQRKKCAQEKISPREFFENYSVEQFMNFEGK